MTIKDAAVGEAGLRQSGHGRLRRRRDVEGAREIAGDRAPPGVRLGTSVPRRLTSDCPENAPDTGDESFPTVTGYTLPAQPQKMPGQEPGKPRRPSGLTC